jgi:hypothetical protein
MMRTAQARRRDASLTLTYRPARGTAAAGSTFTLLLLLSAGMAAVPAAADPVERVRDFYLRHAGVVVVAQLVALLAAASFALFAWLLAATAGSPAHGRRVRRSGQAVAVVAAGTSVPVLWLCAAAHDGSNSLIHRLTVAADWTDVVLFATIAGFSASVSRAARRRWLRSLAMVVTVVAAGRAVLLGLGMGTLELIAPLAFLALVGALSAVNLSNRRASCRLSAEAADYRGRTAHP